ncbi:MAG TPA: DUF4404 family protein [Chitinivibrionales bacterium]|nr:DUF4404 family protein [Chitinivibrionales bacterium]
MNNFILKEHLEHLHEELQTIDAVDEESKTLLAEIQADVRTLLAHKGATPSPHHAPIKERLAESARHFDSSHPTLAATIRTVVNALNNMGI